MKRSGAQTPCPKSVIQFLYAEGQHAVIRDRLSDRSEMRYAWREGIEGGRHRVLRLYSFPLCSVNAVSWSSADRLSSSFRDGTQAIRSGNRR